MYFTVVSWSSSIKLNNGVGKLSVENYEKYNMLLFDCDRCIHYRRWTREVFKYTITK